jgi:flagella basal body P-ring formation protein FlgA
MINMFVPPVIVVAAAALAFIGLQARDAAASKAELQTQLEITNRLFQQLDTQKKAQEKENATLEKQVAVAQATEKAYSLALRDFVINHDDVNGDLETVTGLRARSVKLEIVDYTTLALTVNGSASGDEEIVEEKVLEYGRALRASGKFPGVFISQLTATKNVINFWFSLGK